MNKKRVIYLDVGCWQSREGKDPTMTFALIEHNTIALCDYFSNGKKFDALPFINKFEYDFTRTLTFQFLAGLLMKKYGQYIRIFDGRVYPDNEEYKGRKRLFIEPPDHPNFYHIKKLISFPPRSLLDDENKLLIFIPDLHLHYFKLSYLDKFITWYRNEWDYFSTGKPIKKPLNKRISMENDFSNLLEQIIEFQKDKSIKTHVYILGDLTEMWGTRACIEYFIYNDFDVEIKKLAEQIKDLYKSLEAPAAKNFLKKLIKIDERPTDPIIMQQTSSLLHDKKALDKIYIFDNESGESFRQKAKNLESCILKKYKNKDGTDFEQLFGDIEFKHRINGNHDNFLQIDKLQAFKESFNLDHSRFQSNLRERQTDYLILHGHNLDKYNSDNDWYTGYYIVGLLNLLDAKQCGDSLRDFESIVLGDPHQNYMKLITQIFASSKNMVIIHAHTHSPYLEEITGQYEKLAKEWQEELKRMRNPPETIFDKILAFLSNPRKFFK